MLCVRVCLHTKCELLSTANTHHTRGWSYMHSTLHNLNNTPHAVKGWWCTHNCVWWAVSPHACCVRTTPTPPSQCAECCPGCIRCPSVFKTMNLFQFIHKVENCVWGAHSGIRCSGVCVCVCVYVCVRVRTRACVCALLNRVLRCASCVSLCVCMCVYVYAQVPGTQVRLCMCVSVRMEVWLHSPVLCV